MPSQLAFAGLSRAKGTLKIRGARPNFGVASCPIFYGRKWSASARSTDGPNCEAVEDSIARQHGRKAVSVGRVSPPDATWAAKVFQQWKLSV
jgi:hypothetical protein